MRNVERGAIDKCKAATTSVSSWRMKEFITRRSKAVKNRSWSVRRKPSFSQSQSVYIVIRDEFLQNCWLVKIVSDSSAGSGVNVGEEKFS